MFAAEECTSTQCRKLNAGTMRYFEGTNGMQKTERFQKQPTHCGCLRVHTRMLF